MPKQPEPSISRHLLTATKAQREAARSRPLHRLLHCGELGPEQYTHLLWLHRQLLSAAEDSIWEARARKVAEVRHHAGRRAPLLERDLIAFCDKRLDVAAPLNALLDEWTTAARRTTAPAELLGRLFVLEGLPVDYRRLPVDGLCARLGIAQMHYLGAGGDELFDNFRRFCGSLDEAVSIEDSVATEAAVKGARELFDVLDRGFELVGRLMVAGASSRPAALKAVTVLESDRPAPTAAAVG